MFPKRHYNKWRPDELEKLYREYNLRELTIQEISELHGRSVFSILNKLVHENLVDEKWSNARGMSILFDKKDDWEEEEEDDEDEDENESDDDSEYKPHDDSDHDDSDDDDSDDDDSDDDEDSDDDNSDNGHEEVSRDDSNLYNAEIKNMEIAVTFTLKWISIGLVAFMQFYEKNIVPLFRK